MSTHPDDPLADRMAVLLKHARQALTELTGPALAPFGIDGRELAVLTVLDAAITRETVASDRPSAAPLSQQQAAARLGVDRTTMVALVDGLESKGLVARSTDPDDRRRNVVELTAAGRDVFARAARASKDAERRFLAPLGRAEATALRTALRTLIDHHHPPDR
jgi:DNA-binding MarR family transcriptional regulator